MKNNFKPAKYGSKWAVLCLQSRIFSFIGMGKKFCTQKSNELNLGL